MNARFCRLDPTQPDPELLVVGASAGSLLCGGAWRAIGLPTPQCAFHVITGCPCPTCGATRCVLALLHGRIADALAWNPLVFTGLAILIVVNVYAVAVLTLRLLRLRISFNAREGRILRAVFGVLLTANWVYEIHHGL